MGSVREGRDGVAKTDDDEEGHEQKGQAGVPPTWDGSTPFKGLHDQSEAVAGDNKGEGPKSWGLLCWSLWRGLRLRLFKTLCQGVLCGWTAMGMPRRFCLRWTSQSTTEKTSRSTCWEPFEGVTYHTKRSRSETWRDFFDRWGRGYEEGAPPQDCASSRIWRFSADQWTSVAWRRGPELFSTSRGAASSRCPSRIGWGRTRPSWQLASWEQTKRRQAVSCTRRWTMTWRSRTTRMRS